jgi:hypothetical protein
MGISLAKLPPYTLQSIDTRSTSSVYAVAEVLMAFAECDSTIAIHHRE